MRIPKLAIDKEDKNLYYIYLFYVEEKWWAFGYSAYYLNIMYPKLEVIEITSPEYGGNMPCVNVPNPFLVQLSELYRTLASDAYIQISTPPIVYCYRKEYDDWCMALTVN